VRVYDVLGRQVGTVYRSEVEANTTKRIEVNSRSLASGVYFMRVVGDDFRTTRKMTVID
jgi:hypothetical protein